jgi:predicted PurR-regulated permease PerM
MTESNNFNSKIAMAVFIVLLILSGFALIVFHLNFFLLLFAGIFLAVVLNSSSNWISKKLKTKYGLSLVVVISTILGVLTAMILLIGPSIAEQMNEMSETLPKSLLILKEKIVHTEMGQKIFDEIPYKREDLIGNKGEAFSKITRFFSSTLGVFTDIVIILFTGIFLAAEPETYKKGFISLFPVKLRQRLGEVLHKTHDILSMWMITKLISMLLIGISSGIGLHLIGIPVPYGLALMAGLFSFIPNIGPYLGLIPAVLIAFMGGADKALYVIILFTSIQFVESYLITPFIERKMVSLPAALSLVWLVLFGLFAGIIGLILATPLLVATIVIIDELYVKDYLEYKSDIILK